MPPTTFPSILITLECPPITDAKLLYLSIAIALLLSRFSINLHSVYET